MKLLSTFTLLALWSAAAIASPPTTNDPRTKQMPDQGKYRGIKYMRVVLPGVLYRGGSTGGKTELGDTQLQALCEDGFSSAVYAYSGARPRSVKCLGGTKSISYESLPWDERSGRAMHQFLSEVHSIIRNGKGPMYEHCWFGNHASGHLSAIAIRQFCVGSNQEALRYWHNSLASPGLIQDNVNKSILSFQPYPELEITEQERARVCPR